MLTFFITANDTDTGKTYVSGVLARHFAAQGRSVQIVKALECGGTGDAEWARAWADSPRVSAHTLISRPAALAPLAQPNQADGATDIPQLLAALNALPETQVRLIEAAGGIAVPLEPQGRDWRDFIDQLMPDFTVLVVQNRLGAINQGRLAANYLGARPFGILLNAQHELDWEIKQSNLDGLLSSQLPLIGCLGPCQKEIHFFDESLLTPTAPPASPTAAASLQKKLAARHARHAFRSTTVRERQAPELNLSDNDYLGLSQHPQVIAAAQAACAHWGTSAAASPLISGYTRAHADLEACLCQWYGGRPCLVWNSGYSANQSVLKLFIQPGDLVLADRLIHNSLISGILGSGARLLRFAHNDLAQLEQLLQAHQHTRRIHVVTESVYSMDGDSANLKSIAALKANYQFQWFLDEAHAVGWYGTSGAGLAEAEGVLAAVDVLTGTLGKALGSSGAYTVFNQAWMRDYCVNEAAEFIYSTYLPPACAAAAMAAVQQTQKMTAARQIARQQAHTFRGALRAQGWEVSGLDSPIVPILCGESERALELAATLRTAGISVAAIRPPTVPAGTARLRISLKSKLSEADYDKLLHCFKTQGQHD